MCSDGDQSRMLRAATRVCQHITRMVYIDGHGYDAESPIIEKIPDGGCVYVYVVGDFNFSCISDNEQLPVVPLIIRRCVWPE